MNAALPILTSDGRARTLQRARGIAHVAFKAGPGGTTRLKDLYQDGSAKIRLPNTYGGEPPVAVFINTAGGVTGGDHILLTAAWEAGTAAVLTSQAAERIYRRSAGVARIENRLVVGPGATAAWLPQETIAFNAAGLQRTLEVDLAATGRLTAVESVVLGRTAMGEEVRELTLSDRWTLRRDGRLVYADALRLVGDTRTILSGPATGSGARAFATVVHAAPDAEARVEGVRALLQETAGATAGASAFDGLLVVRALASDGRTLRSLLEPLLSHLTGSPLPRVWSL